ncbi:hypothetical protein [uncultured Enterovirga sp.]|uniref:hypothetical protein n=1 Tax=uncultured Enterovirga sp. TaxID=2026352 RepID=UPI0035CBF815
MIIDFDVRVCLTKLHWGRGLQERHVQPLLAKRNGSELPEPLRLYVERYPNGEPEKPHDVGQARFRKFDGVPKRASRVAINRARILVDYLLTMLDLWNGSDYDRRRAHNGDARPTAAVVAAETIVGKYGLRVGHKRLFNLMSAWRRDYDVCRHARRLWDAHHRLISRSVTECAAG